MSNYKFLLNQRSTSYRQRSLERGFSLQIESKAIPVTKFADDNKYKIWGFHFFNRDERSVEFDNDMIKL